MKAFRATLEEVVEAQLLLHVIDASSPAAIEHTARVREVLQDIGAGETPQLLVFNKVDNMPEGGRLDAQALAARIAGDGLIPAVAVSARTGEGFADLLAMMDRTLALDPVSPARYRIPLTEGALVSLLHERARVTSARYTGEACELEAETPESIQRRLRRYAG